MSVDAGKRPEGMRELREERKTQKKDAIRKQRDQRRKWAGWLRLPHYFPSFLES